MGFALQLQLCPAANYKGSIGGSSGLYQLAIEPWDGHPVRLEQALAAGTTRRLLPGQPLDYEAAMLVYTGLASVSAIHLIGSTYTFSP